MKLLKIAILCLASVCTMSLGLTKAAEAAPLFLVCLPLIGGKYIDDECKKPAMVMGIYEQFSLGSKSVTVKLNDFSLRLEDKGSVGGTSAVKCNGTGSEGWGLIENSNKAVVKVAKVNNASTNCERVEGGCKAGQVEAVEGANLPWETEIFETESKFLTAIKKGPGAAGEPGWKVTCNTLLGSQTDTCTTPAGSPEFALLTNEEISGVLLVKGEFEKKVNGNCTQGGNGQGKVAGLIATQLWTGLGLSIDKT